MPQENDCGGQMKEALEILGMVLVTHNQSSEVKKPGEEPLDFPAPCEAAEGSAILGFDAAIFFVGSNEFGAVLLHQVLVESVAVVGFVTNQALGHLGNDAFFQGGLHQLYFRRRSAFCPQGERKTRAVCNAHDLGALAPLGFPDQAPPFLAGTNVPSTKHSLRSNPPASWRCWARVNRSISMTPERTQFWNRRWAAWKGPYRGGKSSQVAPVRRIHKIPFSTVRRSLHGRPRPSSRTASRGRIGSTIFHCWSVKSIHNYLYINHKRTRNKLYYL